MEQKIAVFQNRGMTRDLSVSKVNNEFAYENFNVRIIARDHDTLLSVTNERGNQEIALKGEDGSEFNIAGILLGYAVLNSYVVLFTHEEGADKPDHIYRIHYTKEVIKEKEEDVWTGKELYNGDLKFKITSPIETLPFYETEDIQKVYWVDGTNQPRMINITGDVQNNNDYQFDFVTTFKTNISVDISKKYLGAANFPSGTIQYIFTYSNKFGQETNIVYKSPIYYLSNDEGGLSADSLSPCAFEFNITKSDKAFKYLNIYSIIRTSKDGAISAKKVITLPTGDNITYIDTGASGISIDASTLLFIGGKEIIPGTLSQKDNTLFIGDITLKTVGIIPALKNAIDATFKKEDNPYYTSSMVSFVESDKYSVDYPTPSGYYPFKSQLDDNSFKVLTYKGGEKYRFALTFVTPTGQRSPAYWIGDSENPIYPKIGDLKVVKAIAVCRIPKEVIEEAIEAGYCGVVLQRAIMNASDRSIIAQGVVAPTLFNITQRLNNAPFAISSWFFRPKNSSVITNKHYSPLPLSGSFNAEIQNSMLPKESSTQLPPYYDVNQKGNKFVVSMSYSIWLHHKFNYAGGGASTKAAQLWATVILTYNTGKSETLYYQFKTDWYSAWGYNYAGGMRKQFDKAKDEFIKKFKIPYSESYLPDEDTWNQIREYAVNHKTGLSSSQHEFTGFGPFKISGLSGDTNYNWAKKNGNTFYVDESIFTFHSPDITKDSNSSYFNANLKFRIIGGAKLTGATVSSDVDLEEIGDIPYNECPYTLNYNNISNYPDIFPTFPWIESTGNSGRDKPNTTGYMIYPWHKTGAIWKKKEENKDDIYLKLKKKTLANVRYSYYTVYGWTGDKAWTPSQGIEDIILCGNTERDSYVFNYDDEPKLYYGDYDFILTTDIEEGEDTDASNYPLYNTGIYNFSDGYDFYYKNATEQTESILHEYGKASDPINIAAKSTPHLLISLRNNGKEQIVLPSPGETVAIENEDFVLPWKKSVLIFDIDGVVVENSDLNTPVFTRRNDSDSTKSILEFNYQKFKASYEKASSLASAGKYSVYMVILQDLKYYTQKINSVYYKLPQPKFTVTINYNEDSSVAVISSTVDKEYENLNTSVTLYKQVDNNWEAVSTGKRIEVSPIDEKSVFRIGVKAIYDADHDADSTELFTPNFNISNNFVVNSNVPTKEDITFVSGPITNAEGKYTTSKNTIYSITNTSIERLNPYGLKVKQELLGNREGLENEASLNDTSVVLIGEVYNGDITPENDTRYGGFSEEAVESNVFVDAGYINYFEDFGENEVAIDGPEGDSYFQRYDFLKTIPYADNKENSVIEVLSCMIESRTNLDGRTDRQRNIPDNTLISPESFNTINPVYTQEDTFITGAVLDDKFALKYFPTQITWTKQKTIAEEVDSWTNITLAGILDMDGDKGVVRAIRRFQNSLIAFQDKGIAEILFNSRTQIGTQQGVPIEIANSGKVDGKRYITDKAGCINKWSIVETKNGIYFIDNINSSLSLFNGSVKSLSDEKGFKDWIGRNNSTDLWNPVDFSNFVAYWDRVNDDVYFLRGNEGQHQDVLCYNEMLGQFTSFFNYGEVPMMVNVQDKFISFKDGKLWEQGKGLYGHIYGEYQDFHMLYRVTPDPYGDKTFTNLEYRADMFDMDKLDDNSYMQGEGTLTGNTFDTLDVWNEYQGNTISIKDSKSPLYPFGIRDKYPDIRRKFRIWRMDIPRDKKNPDNPHGLNRIRNPWIYLKLSKTPALPNERMEFHDLQVRYFE